MYNQNNYQLSQIWNCDKFGAQARQNGRMFILVQTSLKYLHLITLD